MQLYHSKYVVLKFKRLQLNYVIFKAIKLILNKVWLLSLNDIYHFCPNFALCALYLKFRLYNHTSWGGGIWLEDMYNLNNGQLLTKGNLGQLVTKGSIHYKNGGTWDKVQTLKV